MRIVYNRRFPFGHFWAINIFGVVFARIDYGMLGAVERNHEHIHTLQQRELLFLGFYLLYVSEWLLKLAYSRNFFKAYRNISFEREAYDNQNRLDYSSTRCHYAWLKHIKN